MSRRRLLRIFQVPGLIVVPLVFCYRGHHEPGARASGACSSPASSPSAQFSFWGNYLPRVYPTHLRGTGEGFAANIGGRMLGTGFAFVTTQLANIMPGATPPMRLAYASAAVAVVVFAAGLAMSAFLPEPRSEQLPD